MPKKKTGQRKKKEKQRLLQKAIQAGTSKDDFKTNPANFEMICDKCEKRQKSRLICYFCSTVQKVAACAECGRTKCVATSGDCMVKHPGRHVTGMQMAGAICDFCEAMICHSKKCLQTHACSCLFREDEDVVVCIECERCAWDHGGRVFRCATCWKFLCEDDQFEHQASCQFLESETFKCGSCNKLGAYSCLRCKICYCTDHAKSLVAAARAPKGPGTAAGKAKRGTLAPRCKKCGFELQETMALSMSVRRHQYGRHAQGRDDYDEDYGDYGGGGYGGGGYGEESSDDEDYEDDDDDEEEEEEEDSEEGEDEDSEEEDG